MCIFLLLLTACSFPGSKQQKGPKSDSVETEDDMFVSSTESILLGEENPSSNNSNTQNEINRISGNNNHNGNTNSGVDNGESRSSNTEIYLPVEWLDEDVDAEWGD